MIHIMHCREIARILDSDAAEQLSWLDRTQLRVHLWTCWHCRLLVRQLRWLGEKAREHVSAPPSEGLEKRILDRL